MIVVLKKPNELFELLDIKNDLKTIQNFVGGYIEEIHLENKLIALVDEDGDFKNLKDNIKIFDTVIRGNVLFVKESEDEMDFEGLNSEDILNVVSILQHSEIR